jgi:hypothetical protein
MTSIPIYDMGAKESAIAKSHGQQKEQDMTMPDATFFKVLHSKEKISKQEANYLDERREDQKPGDSSCIKCKFNLGDEKNCHIVRGEINDYGISRFFSAKGDGMLPGDIVWDFIKKTGRKLEYDEGHVIDEGADGFQCKDCKYLMYSGKCLLIKGDFTPEMSCGFVVKIGNGTEV